MMAPFVLTTTTTEEKKEGRRGEEREAAPMVYGAKRMGRAPSFSGRPCVILNVTFVH